MFSSKISSYLPIQFSFLFVCDFLFPILFSIFVITGVSLVYLLCDFQHACFLFVLFTFVHALSPRPTTKKTENVLTTTRFGNSLGGVGTNF